MDSLGIPIEEVREARRHASQLADSLGNASALALFAGVLGTAIAGVILTNGARCVLAWASLGCFCILAIEMMTVSFHDDFRAYSVAMISLIFFTVLSVVMWPSKSAWVNGPILSGTSLAALLAIAMVVIRPSIHHL